jgi:hypothetical protein
MWRARNDARRNLVPAPGLRTWSRLSGEGGFVNEPAFLLWSGAEGNILPQRTQSQAPGAFGRTKTFVWNGEPIILARRFWTAAGSAAPRRFRPPKDFWSEVGPLCLESGVAATRRRQKHFGGLAALPPHSTSSSASTRWNRMSFPAQTTGLLKPSPEDRCHTTGGPSLPQSSEMAGPE